MSFSELSIEIALCAFNLETNCEVKESLEKLVQLEITKEDQKIHDLMKLAKKFMMTDGVKDDARKLIAKIRRLEGVSSRSGSGSPTEQENRKRSREVTPEEEMLSSKRTAPVKYAGKKRVLDIAPEDMTLEQLQEFVAAHPTLAEFMDRHFEKFVHRDYPTIYRKPDFFTWKEHYDNFAKNCKPKVSKDTEVVKKQEEPKKEEKKEEEQKKNEEAEKKKSEEDEKLNKFLERKRATAVRKVLQKPVLIETAPVTSAVSIRESYREARMKEMAQPVAIAKPARKNRRRC